MAAFPRFDPYAVLRERRRDQGTLAGLAGLAGAPAPNEISAKASAIADPAPTNENQQRAGGAAKVANAAQPASAPRWGETEEERAAIIQHDGGIPRAWAEGFARLDPDRPPGDVPLGRWQRFVDDVGRFLDLWAAHAAALGWGPHDLFGCDRDRPLARIDLAGLLWLLNGDKLVALTENTAIIERRAGARQTYRRKPNEPARMLVWELT